VQALLARGASVAATNGAQMTPLLEAAFARKTAVVEALLEAGSDVNAASFSGRTALMYAAQSGDAATLRILADRGAELELRTKDGQSALDLAASDEVKEQLVARGAQQAEGKDGEEGEGEG
jgi:ankyrin repeat protein